MYVDEYMKLEQYQFNPNPYKEKDEVTKEGDPKKKKKVTFSSNTKTNSFQATRKPRIIYQVTTEAKKSSNSKPRSM